MITPEQMRKEANDLYNSFPVSGRDMGREEFIRRYLGATDPIRVRQDLAVIIGIKQTRRTQELINRRQIDES